MPEIIKYKVIRLPGPEDQLASQLDNHGTRLWQLVSLLHQARPDDPNAGPWLAVFSKKETVP